MVSLVIMAEMQYKTVLGEGGRVVVPAEVRRKRGLKKGDPLIMQLRDAEVCMFTQQQAVERAQTMVRRYVPEERSLVAELIRERREESDYGAGGP